MQNLTELFEFIGKRKFLETYTDIPVSNGIQSRLIGKGTNAKDKRTEPSPEEIEKIKTGFNQFLKDAQNIVNKL